MRFLSCIGVVGLVDGMTTTVIEDCVFRNLNTQSRYAISLQGTDELRIENCEFTNGIIYGFLDVEKVRTVSILSTRFDGNHVLGVGMVLRRTSVNIENVTITNTVVSGISGSFMVLADASHTQVSNCLFEGNEASLGGVITVGSAHVEITDSQMLSNTASYGGSLYFTQGAVVELSHVLVGSYYPHL